MVIDFFVMYMYMYCVFLCHLWNNKQFRQANTPQCLAPVPNVMFMNVEHSYNRPLSLTPFLISFHVRPVTPEAWNRIAISIFSTLKRAHRSERRFGRKEVRTDEQNNLLCESKGISIKDARLLKYFKLIFSIIIPSLRRLGIFFDFVKLVSFLGNPVESKHIIGDKITITSGTWCKMISISIRLFLRPRYVN